VTVTYVEIARHRKPGEALPPLRDRAEASLGDADLQGALANMAGRFNRERERAMAEPGMAELRTRAEASRTNGVAAMRHYLTTLEASLRALGVHVHHAPTASDARRIIGGIAADAGVRRIVKSKSMATEEIDLNAHLEAQGIDVVETDLGEWIIQKAHERPSHIIAPAVHKSRGQVTTLFSELAGAALPDRREDLCAFAQERLRDAFLTADMGISGVNFACADTGTIALVTNEDNGRMTTSLPRVHVAVMPIEKVLPTFADLATMLPILVRNATGQKLSTYVTLLTGPRRAGELDGPEEMHVVILDNGRSALLGGPYEAMLRCIRCGACLNVCPVYGTIGGHAYGGVYSGPMGAVLTPLLSAMGEGADLPGASSLCGACSEACPVGIPLAEMLIELRADAQSLPASEERSRAKRWFFGVWSRAWSVPLVYRATVRAGSFAGRRAPALVRRLPGVRRWADGRELPPLAAESFHDWWRREHAG
jgi:L-lactate dehydrogenase complex protein LldF